MGETVPNTNTTDAAGAPDLRGRILDAALTIAEEKGRWSAVRLHDVADRLSVPPSRVLDYYHDLDAVADAWFLRGLKAMAGPTSWSNQSGGGSSFACSHGSTRWLRIGERAHKCFGASFTSRIRIIGFQWSSVYHAPFSGFVRLRSSPLSMAAAKRNERRLG